MQQKQNADDIVRLKGTARGRDWSKCDAKALFDFPKVNTAADFRPSNAESIWTYFQAPENSDLRCKSFVPHSQW